MILSYKMRPLVSIVLAVALILAVFYDDTIWWRQPKGVRLRGER